MLMRCRPLSAPTPLARQRGVAMVFIAVGLVALLLMVGLALDVGHATLNETRLQDATDAAALGAAKILDGTHSTILATTEALTAFSANANASGDQELATAYASGNGSVSVTVQYSATLPPFTAGAPNGPYVRVSATGFSRPTWFAQLAGIPQMTVAATAVAGPSPTLNNVCNVVPLMVCGQSGQPNFGYNLGQAYVLKQSAPGNPSEIGPGNFQLIQLGGSGANVVRQNLAGDYAGCASVGQTLQTQTGDETGPVADGLNTRFGLYQGPVSESQYPPDLNTTQQSPLLQVGSGPPWQVVGTMNFDYTAYQNAVGSGSYTFPPPTGVPGRRVLAVPIGDCSGTGGGQTSVNVLGFACFFLAQAALHQGNNDWIFGEFLGQAGTGNGGQGTGNCTLDGVPGPNPGSGPGPYIIQLYHDPGSGDS